MSLCIKSSFFGDYKIGDNVAYNTNVVLKELYAQDSSKFFKAKTIICCFIIDALLYDFYIRIHTHTRECKLLTDELRKKIRGGSLTKVSGFDWCVKKYAEHKLLGKSKLFYQQLDIVRQLRNRSCHIQNERALFKRNEADVFTSSHLLLSEKCCEYTLRYLSTNCKRPPYI